MNPDEGLSSALIAAMVKASSSFRQNLHPAVLMEKQLDSAEREALVDIVKIVQKRGMRGAKGSWKEFLRFCDRQLGDSLSDPAKRSTSDLCAFIKTFTEQEDLKLFSNVLRCHSNRKLVEYMKTNAKAELPEQRLVRLTLEHPEYPLCYAFPSYDKEWVVTKIYRKISKALRSNAMLAIDCEMVLCQDGTEAVVKVCLVNRKLEVKLNQLVKPKEPIVDYRTEITGITAEDLEGVTCSLSDVQNSLMHLLNHGAILVGHSLNNDLRALKLDHARVIDTCFIFKFIGGPTRRRPSLNNLCKSVLGSEVRKDGAPHNCLDDARAAMRLVLAKLEHGFEEGIKEVGNDVPETEQAKLFIHRIPIGVPLEELREIFSDDFSFELQPTQRIQKQHNSAFAVFKDQHKANEAFKSIEGDEDKDSSGRPQKLVSVAFSKGLRASVYVRKMVADDPSVDQSTTSSKKRSAQIDSLEDSKKQKTDTDPCVNHLKEIESLELEVSSLKEVLHRRDAEILNLQKIIAALTRKQGL